MQLPSVGSRPLGYTLSTRSAQESSVATEKPSPGTGSKQQRLLTVAAEPHPLSTIPRGLPETAFPSPHMVRASVSTAHPGLHLSQHQHQGLLELHRGPESLGFSRGLLLSPKSDCFASRIRTRNPRQN